MRLPGFCTGCRRIKQVKVDSNGMAMLAMRKTVTGICSVCEQKDEEDRLLRRWDFDPRRLTPRERSETLHKIRSGQISNERRKR